MPSPPSSHCRFAVIFCFPPENFPPEPLLAEGQLPRARLLPGPGLLGRSHRGRAGETQPGGETEQREAGSLRGGLWGAPE